MGTGAEIQGVEGEGVSEAAGILALCFRCVRGDAHPWCDGGEAHTRDIHLWELGGPLAGPTQH